MNGVQREMSQAKAQTAKATSDATSEDHMLDHGQESWVWLRDMVTTELRQVT